jgi:PGM1 C-terminal domain
LSSYAEIQGRLSVALAANRPDSTTDHVVVALPSYSVGESLLSHYADRIPVLEHRYLVAALMLGRLPHCELVFVASRDPGVGVLDYYASLLPRDGRTILRERLHTVVVPDLSARSVAAKLLDRGDLLEYMKQLIGDRPAVIEPWNVSDAEMKVALALGVPINGSSPDVWSAGFKSAGRRLFREAGVPVPVGVEDVQSLADVVAGIERIRKSRPELDAVVLKLDDSGAGDGNVVIDVCSGAVQQALARLPEWYVRDLSSGGVVEERVRGLRFASPSAQIDVLPEGRVAVLATHEQVLGGPDAQVYTGCRFPADPAYSTQIAEHAEATGRVLAESGVIGRASVDFAATQDGSGHWQVFALEINLRKGGTTHPFAVLRNAVPGNYDIAEGCWRTRQGTTRCYSATDNLMDPAWTGLPPEGAIRAVKAAGLDFRPSAGTGVVLHMLSGLGIDGRVGLTAIAETSEHAERLLTDTRDAIGAAVA